MDTNKLLKETSTREIEGLDEPQRILYDRLKAWRKERAEKEGLPVAIP